MRKLTRSDLSWLVPLRDAYVRILKAVNECKREETELGMLVAYAAIVDETTEKLERTRKDIARLDRLGHA